MRLSKLWFLTLALVLYPSLAATAPQTKTSTPAAQSAPTTKPATTAKADAESEASAAKLPVRRVVLYKTGVGYFEHSGQVRGNQTVEVDFTSSQLNDVLQSLTVLDLSGGRIAGVNYNSEAPLSQRLGMLRLPLEEKTDLSKFYAALRGAHLEVRSGTSTITGRLLSVERKTRVSGGTTLEVDLATLVSDSGEVHSVEITPAVSVRLTEGDVNREVGQYLSLLASMRQEDVRRMTIATAGTGDRQLYVSYISETPIWKTTYRVVLPANGKDQPLLQGWAIVDNTVGEDWTNVELSLVAGAPQSFIQQLSQAYYGRRAVVPLPQYAQLAPQTHEGAMLGGSASLTGTVTDPSGAVIANARVQVFSPSGQIAATVTTDNQGNYQVSDLPAAEYRIEFSSPGFQKSIVQQASLGGGREFTQNVTLRVGSVSQSVDVMAEAGTLQTTTASIGSAKKGVGSGRELGGNRDREASFAPRFSAGAMGAPPPAAYAIAEARGAAAAAAQATDLGDLFEYKLKDRVTIHKNESALVPIVQVPVAAEKVSLWNSSLNSLRPLRALWLTNSSALTLDGGSFSVIENEAFAGEGLIDATKPGERRLLSYAVDLGVRVDRKAESQPQHVTRVRISRGVMIQTSETHQETSYTIRNDDITPRSVLIEHPLQPGWLLSDQTPKPEETTSSAYRFRQAVDPKATVNFTVLESRPIETRYELTNLTNDQIVLFERQKSINPEVETALKKIIEQKGQVADLDAQISSKDDETMKIYDDQERIRENLKALKGTAEERALTQRYTQQLSDQETRLEAIQRETADLTSKREQAQAALDAMVNSLTLEATL
jgi:hypothetical protein